VRLLVALVLLAPLAAAAPARATVPGEPGRIVFASDFDLVTVAAGGGPTRPLVTSGQDEANPSWSPDGERVAFQRSVRGVVTIWVARADGSRPRRLGDGADPAFSPDGARLAFVAQTGRNYDLWVMDADGGGRVRLTTGPTAEFSPTWSPDGRRLAFARFDTSGRGGGGIHWIKAVPNFRPQRVTKGVHDHPSYSPDGTMLAFDGVGAAGGDVFVVGVDGRGVRTLTRPGGNESAPAWSPDGRRIAFVSDRGTGSAVWSAKAEGGVERRLTRPLGIVGSPDWQSVPRAAPPPPAPPPPPPPAPA
jgi:TolB protein